MSKINSTIILEKAASLYAREGFETFSIRRLASYIPITPSVIYHYFQNEEMLLLSMYEFMNSELGKRRKLTIRPKSAAEMLKKRIEFQLDNSEYIVAVLKYYLAHRLDFPKNTQGFVPDKSALHIEEVLEFGIKTGEFKVVNIQDDAKVITHAINGFLLEYYPHAPIGKEKKELINRIYSFLIRALKGGEHI